MCELFKKRQRTTTFQFAKKTKTKNDNRISAAVVAAAVYEVLKLITVRARKGQRYEAKKR